MSDEEYIDESYIDGGSAPEIEEKADGRVTIRGEEIPDDVTEVKQDLVDEKESSKPGEPEGVISETGEPKLSPEETRFQELGLSKQYPGGIKEMVEKMPKTNKYITDLEAERNRYRDELANREPEATEQDPTRDDFFDDPIGITSKVMDSKISEINKQLDSMRVEAFINSKQDYKQLEATMIDKLAANPALKALGVNAIPVLYEMAKAEQLSQAQSTTQVQPKPEAKANAETSAGKKTPTVDKNSRAYWQNKSVKEMEDELGYSQP